jgi:hypothetical protein
MEIISFDKNVHTFFKISKIDRYKSYFVIQNPENVVAVFYTSHSHEFCPRGCSVVLGKVIMQTECVDHAQLIRTYIRFIDKTYREFKMIRTWKPFFVMGDGGVHDSPDSLESLNRDFESFIRTWCGAFTFGKTLSWRTGGNMLMMIREWCSVEFEQVNKDLVFNATFATYGGHEHTPPDLPMEDFVGTVSSSTSPSNRISIHKRKCCIVQTASGPIKIIFDRPVMELLAHGPVFFKLIVNGVDLTPGPWLDHQLLDHTNGYRNDCPDIVASWCNDPDFLLFNIRDIQVNMEERLMGLKMGSECRVDGPCAPRL